MASFFMFSIMNIFLSQDKVIKMRNYFLLIKLKYILIIKYWQKFREIHH